MEKSWVHSGEGFEAQLVCIVYADPQPTVSAILFVAVSETFTSSNHKRRNAKFSCPGKSSDHFLKRFLEYTPNSLFHWIPTLLWLDACFIYHACVTALPPDPVHLHFHHSEAHIFIYGTICPGKNVFIERRVISENHKYPRALGRTTYKSQPPHWVDLLVLQI